MQNIITHTPKKNKQTNKQTKKEQTIKEQEGLRQPYVLRLSIKGSYTSPQIFCRLDGLHSWSEYLFKLHQCAVQKPIRYIKRSN